MNSNTGKHDSKPDNSLASNDNGNPRKKIGLLTKLEPENQKLRENIETLKTNKQQISKENTSLYTALTVLYAYIRRNGETEKALRRQYASMFSKMVAYILKFLGAARVGNSDAAGDMLRNLKAKAGTAIKDELSDIAITPINKDNLPRMCWKDVPEALKAQKKIDIASKNSINYRQAVRSVLSALIQFDTIEQIADGITEGLKSAEIFPLYCDELPPDDFNRGLFEEVHEQEAIETPGLFEKTDKGYKLIGNYHGTVSISEQKD